VRDQLGLHPLFYSLVGDDVLLSSSIDLLTAQPAVTPRLNRAAIADFLRQRWLIKEETVYERVSRVPPGHLLRVDRGGARLVRYWNPELPTAGQGWNEKEETERFEFLFDQAVQRGFARGPVGIYLSGGLDSVSVAAIAADDSPAAGLPPPVALSLAFPDPQCNEEDSQRHIAKSLGLPHVIVDLDDTVRPQGLIQRALDLSAARDVPLVNLWSPAYHYLAREARRLGCRTILTGSGGDEWLCVSPLYGADLVRRGDLAGLYRLWRVTQRSHRMTPAQSLRAAVWTFGLRPMLGIAARRGLARLAPGLLAARMQRVSAMQEWLAPDAALRRQLEERSQLYFDQLYDGSVSYYEYECRRALDHPLVAVEYEEWFEDSRLLGVGIHHPFLDVELSEFLFRAQPEVLNRGDRSKGLVRYTLDRRFPQLGFEGHKKVSAVDYFTQVALAQVPEAWARMGGIRALGELGIVDTARIGADGEAIVGSTPVRRAALLWDMLNLEAWVRTHVV
jgi:asparagine synthetase B (glutamine-hydrolysing)